jgi:hypothetical protein
MKSISLPFIVVLFMQFTTLTQAQSIPNGDFENWIIGGGPDLWTTNNLYYPPIECILVYPDFQAYNGNICAMGVVDSCTELSALYPPILTSFDISLSTKPEALHGFYKFFPIGDDLFAVNVRLYTQNVLVGEGSLKSEQMVDDFTEFIVNFGYFTSDIPDMAVIEFTIDSSLTDNQLHQGSKWYIDSLSFGSLSAVRIKEEIFPNNCSLYQNYPNPFNPSTSIQYTISNRQFVTLKVYDVVGSEVATLVSQEKPAGSYEVMFNAANLPSGIFFYSLQAGTFVETKKMVLMK